MLDDQTTAKDAAKSAINVIPDGWVRDAPVTRMASPRSSTEERHLKRLARRNSTFRRRFSASMAAFGWAENGDLDAKSTPISSVAQHSGNVGVAAPRDPAAEAMELLPPSYELRTKADPGRRGRPIVADQSPRTAVALLRGWFDTMKPGTRTGYTKRARQHLRQLENEVADPLALDGATALLLAQSLHDRCIDRSSVRQYRSAIAAAIAGSLLAADAAGDTTACTDLLLAYLIADATELEPTSGGLDNRSGPSASTKLDGSAALGKRVERKTDGDASSRPPAPVKRRRRKALPDSDLIELLEALKLSTSRRAGTLGLLLVALQRTGVRPCEVRQMKLSRRPGGDVMLRWSAP